MKIRNGFVSNSSSSSFVVCLPKSWNPTDEEIDSNVEWDYCDSEDEDKWLNDMIKSIKRNINLLKSRQHTIQQYDSGGEFECLSKLIPTKYIVYVGDGGGDGNGYIDSININKLKTIVEENDEN